MPETNKAQQAINQIGTKSNQAVQGTTSGDSGKLPYAPIQVARRKRWLHAGVIILMSLGAIAVAVYLFRSQLMFEDRYQGILMAFFAMACGGFLVRHAIGVFAEEDKFDEQQLDANQAPATPSESNPAGQETNVTPPLESGQNLK
jgi:hypothetical protein